MSQAFPKLFTPLTVGAHTLRNRVLMGSMHTRIECHPDALARRSAFYAARARGGVAMIITAGYAPNLAGRLEADAQTLHEAAQVPLHRPVTAAVHGHGAKILLQLLHAGRYAKHDLLVAPSAIAAPINRRVPRALAAEEIHATIDDFVRSAELAAEAGYDGVEIMGSEGYLLSQFLARRTNHRTDGWGGSFDARARLPIEIVRRIRARLGRGLLVSYRISALDLVEDGLDGEETVELARRIEAAGADLLMTGIGWHESSVPTIAWQVPRGAWLFASRRLRRALRIPVAATNRINMPQLAAAAIAGGAADLVALARPLLADAEFVVKAAAGRSETIAPCIACNHCLDAIFADREASCLVNPLAGHETQFPVIRRMPRRVAVVGSGPAGLAAAITAARLGHRVTLFEADRDIGGQLNLARRVPGKGEFDGLLAYYRAQLRLCDVQLQLGRRAGAADIAAGGFEHVIVACGARPRRIDLPGIDHPMVADYTQILSGRHEVGARVAIIGSGGIAHDVAELLTSHADEGGVDAFLQRWGVDPMHATAGGLAAAQPPRAAREVTLFRRSTDRVDARLGISTGWIVRAELRARAVRFVTGCTYVRVDAAGLHFLIGGEAQLAAVDTVVVCAGQEPEDALALALRAAGLVHTIVGGAAGAAELDAARAIREGTLAAHALE
jgi:2,4-dienoyl-CoA reductase (NADPH2)